MTGFVKLRAAFLIGCGCAAWPSAGAQLSVSARDSVAADTSVHGHLITRRQLVLGGAAVLATGLLAPLDRPIQRSLQAEDLQDNRGLRHVARAFGFSGGPGPFIAGGSLFVAGRATNSAHVAA